MVLFVVLMQCIMYGTCLNLLPMWGDEAFTVVTASESPAKIIEIVRDDMHPPLYFLLAHWWSRLPIGSDPLLRLRALSALFTILCTLILERRVFQSSPGPLRNWFLLFWGLSPCLLLFGRMARSYSLQLLLAAVAISCMQELLEKPVAVKSLVAFAFSLSALLYTHYLPGISIWLGANLLLLRQLKKDRASWKSWITCNAIVVFLYLPWLLTLSVALHRWIQSQTYNLTGNIWTEQIAKLGYCVYSFAFGEAIPLWLLPVTLALALPYLWLFAAGMRLRRKWLSVSLFVTAIAYLGASHWVSAPFVPASLLFVLPWFLLAVSAGVTSKQRWGAAVGIAILAANAAGIWNYFKGKDLLNAAYVIPGQQMAQQIALHSQPNDTTVWIDAVNFDGAALEYYLPTSFPVRKLNSPDSVRFAEDELKRGNIRHLWFVRSLHDTSSGRTFDTLKSTLIREWPEHAFYRYVELSPTRAVILRILARLRHQDPKRSEYLYEISEFVVPDRR